MFLELGHTKKPVFHQSRLLTLECYRITSKFPTEEKYSMVQQIRRAVLSVHLNIAEGCSGKSENKRKRFFEISRGLLVEIDTAMNIALELRYTEQQELETFGGYLVSSFKQLCGLIG